MATRTKAKGQPSRAMVLARRVAWGVGIVSVLVFAVDGGEYGTMDLLAQRKQRALLEDSVQTLRDSVATLKAMVESIQSDPAVLEQVARERYGMIKGDKEFLYITVPGDSARGDGK
ncbi:MAG: septum formation initiator family protein [Gemmatimonadetes bacterium]|nr:septum formation initiator family protein [Gemmatimonadota bacterium]